ncbi:MAG: MBL fold metallo-hydrolase [Parvibaculum sp.]|uniref:MBL fold metallo-hydrolase n=3 Tax=Parvibaculum sp. TaxID=2024848 RepID=UPI00273046A5|nr:MBL fold metallo-hydrolase [Parvibaculum sp.]MDP1627361.1 MBL fold metallo-hydrolase [Parvibaculum sp.]MDP2149440.1 MBL fold metallo-hydrolase [Parvibaculum sp.]
MKRLIAIGLAGLVVLAAAGFCVIWFSPSLQDGIMKRTALGRLGSGDNSALLTDNSLHVLLCGTGSPMPDPTRANACTAVIAGGHIVIIDTGPGSWSRIVASRLPAGKIGTVLFTHLHSDHIGALGEFAVQSWIGGRAVPLEVYGPGKLEGSVPPLNSLGHAYGSSGTVEVVKGFSEAFDSDSGYRILHHGTDYLSPEGARIIGHEIARPAPNTLVPVFDKDGLKISAFLVNHHPVEPAFGYRVEYGGRVAVISGDTKKTESVELFSKGADLLVHEALNHEMSTIIFEALTETDNKRLAKMVHDTLDYHASPVQAAEIAREADVPLLVLTHLVPPLPNALARHIFMRGVADARGEGDTILGYDGLLVTLPANSKEIATSNLK